MEKTAVVSAAITDGVYRAKYVCFRCNQSPILQIMETGSVMVAKQHISWFQDGTLERNSGGLKNRFIHKCRDGSLGDARFVGFDYVEKDKPATKRKTGSDKEKKTPKVE